MGVQRRLYKGFFMPLFCWILADAGKTGSQNQAIGLAERMGWPFCLHCTDLPRISFRAQKKRWVQKLERHPPYPSIVISAGRRSHPIAVLFKKRHPEIFSIAVLNPYRSLPHFDLVIAPEHENLRGPNVLSIQGVPHRITAEKLKESRQQENLSTLRRPLLGVLIGGASKHYNWTRSAAESLMAHCPPFVPLGGPPRFRALLTVLQKLHIEGWGVVVLPSRRTPAWLTKELEKCAATHPFIVIAEETEKRNPYISVLAASDAFLVTADSVSMISEACATQKPVYIFPLAGFSRKLAAFHDSLYRSDSARPFQGSIDRCWKVSSKESALKAVIAAKVKDFFRQKQVALPEFNNFS
jgi:mitochondrial fission protein ELM1